MKKLLTLFLVLFSTSILFADRKELVRIWDLNNGYVSIKTPNGETKKYTDIESIPQIQYGSRIYAGNKGVTIRLFNNTDIVLEKKQGVFITKDPITNELILMKTEDRGSDKIKMNLIDGNLAMFGSDAKISMHEKYPYVILDVIKGILKIRTQEFEFYDVHEGEYHEAKRFD